MADFRLSTREEAEGLATATAALVKEAESRAPKHALVRKRFLELRDAHLERGRDGRELLDRLPQSTRLVLDECLLQPLTEEYRKRAKSLKNTAWTLGITDVFCSFPHASSRTLRDLASVAQTHTNFNDVYERLCEIARARHGGERPVKGSSNAKPWQPSDIKKFLGVIPLSPLLPRMHRHLTDTHQRMPAKQRKSEASTLPAALDYTRYQR